MLQTRAEKLRKILEGKNLDGFLVSNFYNILYLTGFKTLTDNEREAWTLVTKKNIYLFTDNRYITDKMLNIFQTKLITPEKGLIKNLQEIIVEEKLQKLGFEGDDLKVNELQKINKYLINTEFVPLEKSIIKIREIKDEEEINHLKRACKIADQCLDEIIKTIRPGASEKEIAFKIEFWLKEKGYDLSFYPIIAIDKNSAVPHHDTRNGNNEKVKKNSIILVDYGAKFKDYCSDTTRVVFVGKPTNEMINTYKTLLNAQEKTIERVRADNNPVSIDQFCRQQLTIVDQRLTYSHSTGHGVGLQTHEYPKISFTSTDILLSGQIITIEPGVYFNNKWGMRVEDTVLIKENNEVEVLTKFNKEMIIKS
jgi:Xaa-Pro aminopeptidase